ncbi:hypothetical protein PR202_ga30605 [Eleusine coracana subsp. coracana]|uniref:Uncharacterized protein n=1 Tax=Eleusine coracana subsp. coracana TaxID=191504 RepID=A0AAV5DPD1_ELECO|nr:hypothetical protein PR202_ga30605 [Eleusine coracana subsp. coracana]
MVKLAAQLRDKFFGLVGRISSCGRAHKDAGALPLITDCVWLQHNEIRSRGGVPKVPGGSTDRSH